MTPSPLWFEVAVCTSIFAAGSILFGHFEEGTPRWRRLLKMAIFTGVLVSISARFGRAWFWRTLLAMSLLPAVIHLWWLPRHGINGWTGEPRDRYRALRGWPPEPGSKPGSER